MPSTKTSSRTPTNAGHGTSGGDESALNSSMLTLLEDYEKLKKEKAQLASEQGK